MQPLHHLFLFLCPSIFTVCCGVKPNPAYYRGWVTGQWNQSGYATAVFSCIQCQMKALLGPCIWGASVPSRPTRPQLTHRCPCLGRGERLFCYRASRLLHQKTPSSSSALHTHPSMGLDIDALNPVPLNSGSLGLMSNPALHSLLRRF